MRQIGDLREVETKSYLPGTRMVDLESSGAHALGGFTPGADRGYRVVALAAGSVPEPAQEAGADLVLQLPFDPGTFTAEMIRLSEEKSHRRPSPRAG